MIAIGNDVYGIAGPLKAHNLLARRSGDEMVSQTPSRTQISLRASDAKRSSCVLPSRTQISLTR